MVMRRHLPNMNFKEKVLFNREIMSMPRGVKEKSLYNKSHSHSSTISIGVVIRLSQRTPKGNEMANLQKICHG